MKNLTEHFRLEEFIRSETARKQGIDNTLDMSDPGDKVIVENLRSLCINILEPLRSYAECPIYISSGYRCRRLNAAVGGSKASQHMKGEACDIAIPDVATGLRWFQWMKMGLKYDQLVKERKHAASQLFWIHVSYKRNPADNRQQAIDDLIKHKA